MYNFFRLFILLFGLFVSIANAQQSRTMILIDLESQQTLISAQSDRCRPIARSKNLIDLYTLMQIYKKQERKNVLITFNYPFSRKFKDKNLPLKKGNKVSEELLLKAIVVLGSDSAVRSLVRHYGLTEKTFTEETQKELGKIFLSSSPFDVNRAKNSSEYCMSFNDLSKVVIHLINTHPEVLDWASQKTLNFRGVKYKNSNTLLERIPSLKGLMISENADKSKYAVLISEKLLPNKEKKSLLLVTETQTDTDLLSEAIKFFDLGFHFYETFKIYSKDQVVHQIPVLKGQSDFLELSVNQDVFVTINRSDIESGGDNRFMATFKRKTPLLAPLKKGEQIGILSITFNQKTVASVPLVCAEDLDKGSLSKQFFDSLKLSFQE